MLSDLTEREAFMKLKYNIKRPIFSTASAFNKYIKQNVPLRGRNQRANVNMMGAHYGVYIDPAQEEYWRNIRNFAINEVNKYLNSPKRKLGRKLSTPRRSPKKPAPRRRLSA